MTQFAFVFPGQGSQSLGMLADLAAQYPIVEATFSEASSVLGYDLWQLVQQGPAEELNKTWQTQPALLAASVAIFRVWQQQGGKMPAIMAGHSLGEYSALVWLAMKSAATRRPPVPPGVCAVRARLSAMIGLCLPNSSSCVQLAKAGMPSMPR